MLSRYPRRLALAALAWLAMLGLKTASAADLALVVTKQEIRQLSFEKVPLPPEMADRQKKLKARIALYKASVLGSGTKRTYLVRNPGQSSVMFDEKAGPNAQNVFLFAVIMPGVEKGSQPESETPSSVKLDVSPQDLKWEHIRFRFNGLIDPVHKTAYLPDHFPYPFVFACAEDCVQGQIDAFFAPPAGRPDNPGLMQESSASPPAERILRVLLRDADGKPSRQSVYARVATSCRQFQQAAARINLKEASELPLPAGASSGNVCLVVSTVATPTAAQQHCIVVSSAYAIQLPDLLFSSGVKLPPCVIPRRKATVHFKVVGFGSTEAKSVSYRDLKETAGAVSVLGLKLADTATIEVPEDVLEKVVSGADREELEITVEQPGRYSLKRVGASGTTITVELEEQFVRLGQFKLRAVNSLGQFEERCEPRLAGFTWLQSDKYEQVRRALPEAFEGNSVKLRVQPDQQTYSVSDGLAQLGVMPSSGDVLATLSFVDSICKVDDARAVITRASFNAKQSDVVRKVNPYLVAIFSQEARYVRDLDIEGSLSDTFWAGASRVVNKLALSPDAYEGTLVAVWQEQPSPVWKKWVSGDPSRNADRKLADEILKRFADLSTPRPFDLEVSLEPVLDLVALEQRTSQRPAARIVVVGPKLGRQNGTACTLLRRDETSNLAAKLRKMDAKILFVELADEKNLEKAVPTDGKMASDSLFECAVAGPWQGVAKAYVIVVPQGLGKNTADKLFEQLGNVAGSFFSGRN